MDGSGHYYQCWRVSKPLRLRQPRSGALTRWLLMGGIAFAGLLETSWGQKASNWRGYRLADGLPESACMSVTITPQGKVLAKHLTEPSVSELDGYNVNVMSSAEGSNGRVYESPGGQLWTVMAEGLQEFRDGAWMLHRVPEIAAEFRAGLARVIDPIPLFPVRQGVVVVLLPQRLIRFNAENPESPRSEVLRLANQTQLEKFSAMTVARDGGLWIGGRRGLAKAAGPVRNLKLDSEWQEFIPPESLAIESLQEIYEDADGSITALADSSKTHQKMIVHFDRQHWSAHAAGLERIRHGWYGPDKTCWAATIDSLFQWDEAREEM